MPGRRRLLQRKCGVHCTRLHPSNRVEIIATGDCAKPASSSSSSLVAFASDPFRRWIESQVRPGSVHRTASLVALQFLVEEHHAAGKSCGTTCQQLLELRYRDWDRIGR